MKDMSTKITLPMSIVEIVEGQVFSGVSRFKLTSSFDMYSELNA